MVGDRKTRPTGTRPEPLPETAERPRHYWRPADDRVRHAFRGRRWMNTPRETSVCGADVLLHEADETEWWQSPTCLDCNRVLKAEAK